MIIHEFPVNFVVSHIYSGKSIGDKTPASSCQVHTILVGPAYIVQYDIH